MIRNRTFFRSDRSKSMNRKKIIIGICSWSVLALWSVSGQAGFHPKMVGPQACMECHESEGKAWQKTHHFNTFKELHKRKEAKEISEKMGIKRIKKEET